MRTNFAFIAIIALKVLVLKSTSCHHCQENKINDQSNHKNSNYWPTNTHADHLESTTNCRTASGKDIFVQYQTHFILIWLRQLFEKKLSSWPCQQDFYLPIHATRTRLLGTIFAQIWHFRVSLISKELFVSIKFLSQLPLPETFCRAVDSAEWSGKSNHDIR